MENKETMILVSGVITKKTAVGKTYWVVDTDIGQMSTFDDKLAENIAKFSGRKVKVGYQVTDKGFKNLKSIEPMSIPEEIVPDTSVSLVEARKAKDTSIYTSYAKDLFIAVISGNANIMPDETAQRVVMALCIERIKQAKEAFA